MSSPKKIIILIITTSTFLVVLLLSRVNSGSSSEFNYTAANRRNPFIPLITSDGRLLKLEEDTTKKQDLVLEGIIFDPEGISYAIINGEVLRTSDPIQDYVVLSIEKNKVILIKENQKRELQIKEEGQ